MPALHWEADSPVSNEDSRENLAGQPRPTRFKVNGVREDFMGSSIQSEKLIELIDEILHVRSEQAEIDYWYWRFITIYHEEMGEFYKP